MNRRDFLKRTALTPVGYMVVRTGGAIALVELSSGFACNPTSVLNTINGILVEIGPALQIIISLLPLLGVKNVPSNIATAINTWEGRVSADVTALNNLITQYGQALATNATMQAEIAALIQTTENETDTILTVLQVLNAATRQKIENLVNAIGGAIISVENMVLKIEGKVAMKAPKSINGAAIVVTSKSNFMKQYNTILHAPVNDMDVDVATAQLTLK